MVNTVMNKVKAVAVLSLLLGAATAASAHSGGQQYGYGQGQSPCGTAQGMMGPGSGGMMGGHGYGGGMMGPGAGGMMGGYGYGGGMMGPGSGGMMGGGMGYGHGMMGGGHGTMGPGGKSPGYRDTDLSSDEVKRIFEHRLSHHGNERLRVGKVEARDDDTIVAEVETVDGSLVDRFEVDRHTGQMKRIQ